MIKEEKDEPNNVSDANHLKVCCKNLFDCENSCGQHQNTDKEKKQFICRICSKSFKRKDLLTKHEKIHTGKKSHHCKFCSKSFLKRGDLAVHERVHTGEKPFLCKICSASFRQQAHLRTHERTHSGEKSFVCKLCLKSFAYRSQLKNHEKIHTETFNSVERLDEDDFNIPEEKDFKNDLSIHEESIKIEFTSEDVGGDITVDEKPFELNPGNYRVFPNAENIFRIYCYGKQFL
nr:zinc finger protein 883-like [Leptinotarsa decemlineata]